MKKYKTLFFSKDLTCKTCGGRNTYFLRIWNKGKPFITAKCQKCVNEDRLDRYYANYAQELVRQRNYDRGSRALLRGAKARSPYKKANGKVPLYSI